MDIIMCYKGMIGLRAIRSGNVDNLGDSGGELSCFSTSLYYTL
jgi:hypothetical protein